MTRRTVVLALVLTVSLGRDALGQRYLDPSGRLRVSLAQQPLTPNGRSSGPRTMLMGGIQDLLSRMGASVRTAESALTAAEDAEYGGWKRLGMSLGHFADIVSQNERDGVFTVGLLATCPSMPGLIAGLQRSGPTGAPITVGMLWLDAHPDFNTPETTRSGSLGGMPVAVATGRALPRMRLDAKLDPAMRDDHVIMGGVRLTDPLEQELLDASRIRQVSVNDLRTRSTALFAQLDRLHRDTDKLYVHVDMDVLDPREVMGHGNKVPDGPSSEELAALFEEIFRRYPKASAIGFATIPPTDEGGLSIAALNRMIAGAVRGVQARERAAARPATEPPAPAQPARSGNPILAGWYADPEAHVFEGQYWIYPTYSAPYGEQTFMDAFSSRDLMTWVKHPHVLDTANVRWARRALWAPSIVAKGGWYYLFFGANDIQNDQQPGGIGVARARSPAGPFKDMLGKPLIGAFHNGAQPIDQMVFQDLDGAYYIVYGGWRHCNIARLNDDFTGFVPFPDGSTFREITPAGYVEGAYMLVKDGKYYFMWSEGGWTGPNYAVAYAVGTSPFGPFERVGRILQQDSTVATGAGHHSVLHAEGSPNWYIAYHRRPLGETDRNHRVVSIDELRFDAQGFIKPVAITGTGVAADPLPSAPTLQGAYGGAFLVGSAGNEAIVKRDKLDLMTLWGVHDGMSRKNGYPVPGRTNYPLPYSRELKPKPAFDAVLAVPRSP